MNEVDENESMGVYDFHDGPLDGASLRLANNSISEFVICIPSFRNDEEYASDLIVHDYWNVHSVELDNGEVSHYVAHITANKKSLALMNAFLTQSESGEFSFSESLKPSPVVIPGILSTREGVLGDPCKPP